MIVDFVDSHQKSNKDNNHIEESQSSKRSRLADSDSDNENTQPTKKARIVDSDSDDDERPLSVAPAGRFIVESVKNDWFCISECVNGLEFSVSECHTEA